MWKVPVHCSVVWPCWSEIVINDFLHHVLHLFYQCTYNSFFSQIENFAAVVRNYSYLSRSNYRKIIQGKKITSTFLFTNVMSSQIFTIIILAKSFISFKTLFIYCISIHDLCIGNKLFLYRCLKKLPITQLKKLLITHFYNNVWLWLSRIHRMFYQFILF